MVIKDETGEIPCGRMSSVQKWVRAPGLPHCLQWCLQWFLQVNENQESIKLFSFWTHAYLDGFHWIYMVAIIVGFLWLHLDNSLDFSDNKV